MTQIVSFRPGVIGNQTAFECQALIYKYLQAQHGYSFTIVKAEQDHFDDPTLDVISIPNRLCRRVKHTPLFVPAFRRKKMLRTILGQADAVLSVDPTIYPQGLLAIRTAFNFGIPVWIDSSVTLMGMGNTLQWKLAKRIVRPELAKVTGIIVTAPKCIERFQDLALFNEDLAPKFWVMGHPVDCDVFRPALEAREQDEWTRVLVISRLVPEKGLLYIIEAIEPLVKTNPKLKLQILGSGPLKPLIEKEVRDRKIGPNVEFLSPVPHHMLPHLMARADIFLNHAISISKWEEFFGVVNIEAMACGLPCIISQNGAIPYVVRDRTAAVHVEERDVGALRNALKHLVDDPGTRVQIGLSARRYVLEHYDIKIIGEKYRRMIQAGLNNECKSYI